MKTKNEKIGRLLPEIEKRIRELFGEKVLKIIEHRTEEIKSLADRRVEIDDGEIKI